MAHERLLKVAESHLDDVKKLRDQLLDTKHISDPSDQFVEAQRIYTEALEIVQLAEVSLMEFFAGASTGEEFVAAENVLSRCNMKKARLNATIFTNFIRNEIIEKIAGRTMKEYHANARRFYYRSLEMDVNSTICCMIGLWEKASENYKEAYLAFQMAEKFDPEGENGILATKNIMEMRRDYSRVINEITDASLVGDFDYFIEFLARFPKYRNCVDAVRWHIGTRLEAGRYDQIRKLLEFYEGFQSLPSSVIYSLFVAAAEDEKMWKTTLAHRIKLSGRIDSDTDAKVGSRGEDLAFSILQNDEKRKTWLELITLMLDSKSIFLTPQFTEQLLSWFDAELQKATHDSREILKIGALLGARLDTPHRERVKDQVLKKLVQILPNPDALPGEARSLLELAFAMRSPTDEQWQMQLVEWYERASSLGNGALPVARLGIWLGQQIAEPQASSVRKHAGTQLQRALASITDVSSRMEVLRELIAFYPDRAEYPAQLEPLQSARRKKQLQVWLTLGAVAVLAIGASIFAGSGSAPPVRENKPGAEPAPSPSPEKRTSKASTLQTGSGRLSAVGAGPNAPSPAIHRTLEVPIQPGHASPKPSDNQHAGEVPGEGGGDAIPSGLSLMQGAEKDEAAWALLHTAEASGLSARDRARACNDRGFRLLNQDNAPERALPFFEYAAKADPSYGMPRYNAAKCHATHGNLDGVLQYLGELRAMGKGQRKRFLAAQADPAFASVANEPRFTALFQ